MRIACGDRQAIVVEVGWLRSDIAAGREMLDGYAQNARRTPARGHPLIPWPERNAIDGLVRSTNWSVAGRGDSLPTPRVAVAAWGIEPTTGAPDELQPVDGRHRLTAGESLSGNCGILPTSEWGRRP